MAKEMLINVSEGEECRIALLEDGKLEELYMERTSSTSHVGNIYKGRVTNVEPSIQAAFVDFGLGRNGFLHISDLMPTYFGRKGEDIVETVGKKMARRDRPPIQRCLRRGDEIVVQIIKEGIGTKGPTLSTYLSIPGRILVMMPGMSSKGVSRKIEDETERRRLRQILDQLDPPDDCGFIIRTAGVGKTKAEIERDLKYLARLWETLKKVRDTEPAPVELYTEGDLVTRTVRDLFTADVDRIVVDSKDVTKRVRDVIKLSSPRTKNKVDVYEDPIPLFHKYGIEREIELMYSRHVPLPSGGSLVIDSTEAIVAIDVNSGKFRDHSDAEMTAFKTDLEAADEIARQLRLRDLGGVIICDFIDLRFERHRRELEERLHNHLKRDRAKTKMLRMSQFGIIEMTRQRMRPSFKRSVYFDCPHCKGGGLVKTPESMSLDVMRRLAIATSDQRVHRIELAINPDVGMYLLNKKRAAVSRLEAEAKKRIIVRQDAGLALDEVKLDLFDLREGLVILEELAALMTAPPHRTQLTTRQHGQRGLPAGGGRFDGRRQAADSRRPPTGPGQRAAGRGRGGAGRGAEDEMPEAEERYEMASAAFEDREDEGRDTSEDRGQGREEHADEGPAEARGQRGGRDDRGAQRERDQQRDAGRDRAQDRDREPSAAGAGARGGQERRGDQGGRRDQRDQGQRGGRQGGPQDRGAQPVQDRGQDRGSQNRPQDRNGETADVMAGGDEQGGRHRRRRRRGRRGRGRGRGGEGNGNVAQGGPHPALAGEQGEEDRAGGEQQFADRDDRDREREGREDDRERDDRGREFQAAAAPTGMDDQTDAGADTGFDAYEQSTGGVEAAHEPAGLPDRSGEMRRGSEETGGAAEQMTEAASPSAPAAEAQPSAQAPAAPGGEQPAGKGRRRRGSRGGRGRGGKGGPKPAAPIAEAAPAEPAPPSSKARPKSKRGRGRGGAGRGRKNAKAAQASSGPAGSTPAGGPVVVSAVAPPAAPAPSIRATGSTDSHLIHNEVEEAPVMHEPVRRPRSMRDLDHIPEDLD